jgi:hypothetical protein
MSGTDGENVGAGDEDRSSGDVPGEPDELGSVIARLAAANFAKGSSAADEDGVAAVSADLFRDAMESLDRIMPEGVAVDAWVRWLEGGPPLLNKADVLRRPAPSLMTNMRCCGSMIFGPVLCVIPYDDEDEAIAIANDSSYGLQAYVESADAEHAHRVAERLKSGRLVINGEPHAPLAPFGGFKQSGIGREYGRYGLEAHLEVRAILG